MKNLKIDLYKIIFLSLFGILVYCYNENSKIGRFVQIKNNSNLRRIIILDTKSGATYHTKVPMIYYNFDNHQIYENSHSLIK